jgi:protein SCO1
MRRPQHVKSSSPRKSWFAAALVAAGLAAGTVVPVAMAQELQVEGLPYGPKLSGSEPMPGRSAHRIPDVEVLDQDGKRYKLHSDLMKGKVVLFNFMYADCDGICPLQTETLKRVYKEFGDRMGKEIIMLSFTLRPDIDRPEKLKHYTEMHEIPEGGNWKFLTGDPQTFEKLRRALGFFDPVPEFDLQNATHLGMLRYGVESMDRWAGCPAGSLPTIIANNVLRMYLPTSETWLVPDVS